MCPSRWFTPMRSAPVATTTAFAAAIPTSRAPTNPGPTVTATPSRSANRHPARSSASSMSGFRVCTWAREATSGTTPPNRACRSAWLATRLARTIRPSWMTATAVSSHEVSMPRTLMGARSRANAVGELLGQPSQSLLVFGPVHVVDPHDQGVLVYLLVVVLPEAELSVQPLRAVVRDADFQGDGLRALRDRVLDEVEEQAHPDLVPLVLRVDGDVRDVGLLSIGDEPAVPHDLLVHPGHEIAPAPALGHLREEQVGAPRARVDLALDGHHAAQVAAAHPSHLKPWRLGLADPKRSPHPSSSGRAATLRTTGRSPPG